MSSETPKARARLLLPLLPLLAVPACAGAPPIVASPSACSTLIPDSWRAPVPGAELPKGDTVGEWVAFADAQTGQLDKANGRTGDAIDIIERCERRDAAAVKRSKPKVLGLF
jgi:hypothetical protein